MYSLSAVIFVYISKMQLTVLRMKVRFCNGRISKQESNKKIDIVCWLCIMMFYYWNILDSVIIYIASILIILFYWTWVTQRVFYKKQKLPTLREHPRVLYNPILHHDNNLVKRERAPWLCFFVPRTIIGSFIIIYQVNLKTL